jgi:hypothetical protein
MFKGIIRFFKSGFIFKPYSLLGIAFGVLILRHGDQKNPFSNLFDFRIYLLFLMIFIIGRLLFWVALQRSNPAYFSDIVHYVITNVFLASVVMWGLVIFIVSLTV